MKRGSREGAKQSRAKLQGRTVRKERSEKKRRKRRKEEGGGVRVVG